MSASITVSVLRSTPAALLVVDNEGTEAQKVLVRETGRREYDGGFVADFAVVADGVAFSLSISSDDEVYACGTCRAFGAAVSVQTGVDGTVSVISGTLPARSRKRAAIARAWTKAVAAARAEVASVRRAT